MLFVDVDGTLIDGNDKAIVPVVAAVWTTLARGIHPVVIWSGGGADYAEMWARRLFYSVDVAAIAKDPSALREYDTVVDDQLGFKVPESVFLMDPDTFVVWATEV